MGAARPFHKPNKPRKNHEKITCCKITDIGWMEGRENWAGMKAVFVVERTVVCKGRTTVETCCCITSPGASAEEPLRIARGHWKKFSGSRAAPPASAKPAAQICGRIAARNACRNSVLSKKLLECFGRKKIYETAMRMPNNLLTRHCEKSILVSA